MSSDPESREDLSLGPALDFMRHLWRLNHALEGLSRRMDATLEVTAQQRFMIRCIGKYPGITVTQLAAQLHLDPGTVSTSLARLQRKGMLQRRRDSKDRRRVSIGLTARGRAVDAALTGTAEHAVQRLLELGKPTHIKNATQILELLTTLMDAESATENP